MLISVLMSQLNKPFATLCLDHGCAYAQKVHEYGAYQVTFAWVCAFAFIGAITALFIDDKKVLSVFRPTEKSDSAA